MSAGPIVVAEMALADLLVHSREDMRATCVAAYVFLDTYGSGAPDVPMIEERVRDDAKMWAACAQPHELEAYLVAAIMELDKSPLVDKQVKRLAATTFNRMDADDRERFLAWAKKQTT